MSGLPAVVVAGHMCLDIIPAIGPPGGGLPGLFAPGQLVQVGPAVLAPGGAVPNTGLALHRLGIRASLVGKVGDDALGGVLLGVVQRHGPALADGVMVSAGTPTSYTIVISPPGTDRMFFHCPGANDDFHAEDVEAEVLAGARLLHFGYPPLMRRIYQDGGRGLAGLLSRAKALSLFTSLDMAHPDPTSAAGRIDWPAFLARVLPATDLFLPSLEETLFMVDRERFDQLRPNGDVLAQASGGMLAELSDRLLQAGATIIGLKLGDQGLYLRTTSAISQLAHLNLPDAQAWLNRELLAPCFQVDAAGTTGAGDSTVAGFIAGWLANLPPEGVLMGAVAVGACCVEQPDATSGVPGWAAVQRRIAAGWERLPTALPLPGWQWRAERGVWVGPRDAHRSHS